MNKLLLFILFMFLLATGVCCFAVTMRRRWENPPIPPVRQENLILKSPKHTEQARTAGKVMTRAVALPLAPHVLISWLFPVEQQTPDLVFRLRHSFNVRTPLTAWLMLTNMGGTLRSVRWPAAAPCEFFTLTASNYLGESGYATK